MINQMIKTSIQFMIRIIIQIVCALSLFMLTVTANAQGTKEISIGQCYTLARQNYPLIKQQELISKSKNYSVSNLAKGYLPQLSINGQATYQSEVTSLPVKLPNVNVEELSKDQYKLYAEVNQVLYDGGTISQQKKMQESAAAIDEQKLEVELYKLKERINQLYFGILLLQQQQTQTEILVKDLEATIQKTEAAYRNGVTLKSNLELLKAELLKTGQRRIELSSAILAYKEMLGYFIGVPLNEDTRLLTPQPLQSGNQVNRPELLLFDYQGRNMDVQNALLNAKNRPKLGLFIQGGYGRPALNFLSNNFEPYYIGGVRISWNLSGLYSLNNERSLIDIGRRNIDIQRNTFLFNTEFTLKQQNAEIRKLNELLLTDDEIIALRNSIKHSAAAQLENGIINSSDYLKEVNAEDLAVQSKIAHQVQLLLSQYTQQTTTGN